MCRPPNRVDGICRVGRRSSPTAKGSKEGWCRETALVTTTEQDNATAAFTSGGTYVDAATGMTATVAERDLTQDSITESGIKGSGVNGINLAE